MTDRLPLDLGHEAFRAFAQRGVELAADYLASLADRPTFPPGGGASVAELFDGPPPEVGRGAQVLEELALVADASRPGSGRFFGYVFGSGEPVAAVADLYASVLNQNVTAWRSSPAGVTIERTVIRWLAEGVGCGGFTGSFTSGGSSANLMGLAMAREAVLPANEAGARPAIVYVSDEVHMAVPKAVALLGLGRSNVRRIPVDDSFRMRTDALGAAIAEDRAAGRDAVAVVASAGTITTGAVDPLAAIAGIAHASGLWLHVDGAYGALAALAVPERFAGLDQADSMSLDAHKWLYQPVDCSLLLYRDRDVARRTFAYSDDYVRALSGDSVEGFAFFEESVELSRRFRVLKVWLSLRYHGMERFRAAIRQDLEHARQLARTVEADPRLELLAPVELSAVCFRWVDAREDGLDARNADILRRVVQEGDVYLSNATIRGRFALRACIVNHRTTDADVARIVPAVLRAAAATM